MEESKRVCPLKRYQGSEGTFFGECQEDKCAWYVKAYYKGDDTWHECAIAQIGWFCGQKNAAEDSGD